MNTTVIKCSCTHSFQNKRYGAGLRLHNDDSKGGFTCTVCGNSKAKASKPADATDADAKPAKKKNKK